MNQSDKDWRRRWMDEAVRSSGLSAKDIAEATGIPEPNLSQMRKGARSITDRSIQLVASYLGITDPTMYVERDERKQPGLLSSPDASAHGYARNADRELEELRRMVLKLVMRVDDLTEELHAIKAERHRRHA